jgi:dihydrofolate reductase
MRPAVARRLRKIIVEEDISLDGVFEDNGKWRFDYSSDDLADYDRLKLKPDALLIGRKTYELFASYWPNQKSNENGFADKMNSMRKYVVSSRLKRADWNNTTIINGDVPKEISRIKNESGRDIEVFGSAKLVQTLTQHGLVDEFSLLVFPVILGGGKRLFADGNKLPMTLVETRKFSKGVVLLRYRTAER